MNVILGDFDIKKYGQQPVFCDVSAYSVGQGEIFTSFSHPPLSAWYTSLSVVCHPFPSGRLRGARIRATTIQILGGGGEGLLEAYKSLIMTFFARVALNIPILLV